MRKGDKRIFDNKPLLYEMINLRLNGWAYTSLALYFNCDTGTIENQCKKYDIDKATDDIFSIERIISKTIPPIEDNFIEIDGYRICKGHDYSYYLNHQKNGIFTSRRQQNPYALGAI